VEEEGRQMTELGNDENLSINNIIVDTKSQLSARSGTSRGVFMNKDMSRIDAKKVAVLMML
jgi:hypothetical protein